MAHWGWYWKVKKKHQPKMVCSRFDLAEIDSFRMFNDYQQAEAVRASATKCSLEIPGYSLKAYLQDDDSLLVQYQDGSYVIPVERKPCNFGGSYYFFRCPRCNRRMRKLYCLHGKYLCRNCGNLAYYKQRVRPDVRFTLMRMEVEQYVKNRGGNLKFDEKPPRMHRKTFEKLKDRAEFYDAQSGLALHNDLRQWYGSKIERWLSKGLEYEWEYIIEEYKQNYERKKR